MSLQNSASAHLVNSYTHQTWEKVAINSLTLRTGNFVTLRDDGGALYVDRVTSGSDVIEGISITTDIYASDNELQEKKTVIYRPVFHDHTYLMDLIPGQIADETHVGYLFTMDANQDLDLGTKDTQMGQVKIERVMP